MAMLAEKKRRQKWCINPRGKQWSDDQTKFGQRILEKMGWSAGQGLGINKQGPTDIVKVKKKDDSAGLGFKENGERWLETANEYNELLDQLTSTGESEKGQADVSSSLEDRSKKSKARVHYHKFTRGKDLSRYSEKDLASIIGPNLVKCKSVDDMKDDYKANQINKGSLTEYFNGKKKAKHKQSPEPEPTINEDTTNEERAGCLDEKYKTSKKLREDGAENPDYKVNKSHKKSKKSKSDEEHVSDYLSFNDEDLNNRNILTNKNKSLQNGLEIETIEQMNKLKVLSSDSCTDGERIFKANKHGSKIKGENSIKPVGHNSIENPCEEGNEKDVLCEKLPKHKKKKLLINGEMNTITKEIIRENKSHVKTIDNAKTVPFEFEHNCDESNTISKKAAKTKKKEKKLKNEVPTTTPIDNSISNYGETYEDNLTYGLPNTNIQNLENNIKSNLDFSNKIKVKEENLVSKKKKKNKQHIHDNDYVELEMVENENFEKVSKKRKSGNKDRTIDEFVNSCIKRKKGKGENIGSSRHEEPYSVFSTELEKEPLREEQLPKHSIKGNKSKDQNTLDSEVNETLITSVEDSISSCNKKYKDNLTDKLSTNNLQQSEKDCTFDFVNESVISKKKKIKHAVHDNDSVQKLETFENKNFEKKVSRKRKSEDKDKAIVDPESNYIQRKKGKKENIESLTNEEPSSALNPELEKEPLSDKQLPKKKRNKSKDQSNLDREVNADLEEPEKLLNIKEENKIQHETTSINNNEDITSKPSSGCLTVFGRKTRLKNFDITRNLAKSKQVVTEEFMAFSESKAVSSIKSPVFENVNSGENSSYRRIYVEPNDEDSNITMNVANYEYRLLTSKIKQLNIPTDVVKILIKNNVSVPQKLHKKLKLLYKSKYLKSLLPEDELKSIEASVKEFAAKLQPKVEVIKGLLEIENQTAKLANETDKSGMLADSNNKQTEKNNLTPEKKETLKGMKKQLKLLSKVGKEIINATSRNSEESTDKERTKTTPNSKCDYKNENNSRGGAFKEVHVPVGSLQTRIEERLKVLSEQMKQLSERRKLFPDKNISFSNERKSTSSRDKVNQGGCANTSNQGSDSVRTKNGSGHPIYGKSRCRASSRSQGIRSSWGMGYGLKQGGALRERGVKTVLKGRISKNNFDAKQYAMKCKVEKILPEIAFKGVDLKVISGYAANNTEQSAIEPSSHTTNS